jgi:hypothetical protein
MWREGNQLVWKALQWRTVKQANQQRNGRCGSWRSQNSRMYQRSASIKLRDDKYSVPDVSPRPLSHRRRQQVRLTVYRSKVAHHVGSLSTNYPGEHLAPIARKFKITFG